jgi:hypothetical protein
MPIDVFYDEIAPTCEHVFFETHDRPPVPLWRFACERHFRERPPPLEAIYVEEVTGPGERNVRPPTPPLLWCVSSPARPDRMCMSGGGRRDIRGLVADVGNFFNVDT